MLIEPEDHAAHPDERHVLEPPSATSVVGAAVETVRAADRALEAERAAFSGRCAMCGAPFQGRQDKRFCRGPGDERPVRTVGGSRGVRCPVPRVPLVTR